MELEFTYLEMLLIYHALLNTPKTVDRWELERDAEPKFTLSEEERKVWGIIYQGKSFRVNIPNRPATSTADTWQALSAPTVKREFTKPDLEMALSSVRACAWGLEERDYVFALMDKLGSYLQSFDALDALSRLPREVVIAAAEGKLSIG